MSQQTITWTSGSSGNWNNAANWSPIEVPGTDDVALIDAGGTYLVNVGSVVVNSLTLAASGAEVLVGGQLQVTGATVNAGTLAVAASASAAAHDLINTGTIVNNGAFVTTGTYTTATLGHVIGNGQLQLLGTLLNNGATLDGGPFATQQVQSVGTVQGGVVTGITSPVFATLDGVTWRGPLTPTSISIVNGLSVTDAAGNAPGTIDMAVGGLLRFQGTQTFDSGTIQLRAPSIGTIDAADSLTLGLNAQIVERGLGTTQLTVSGNSIENLGTVSLLGGPPTKGFSEPFAVIQATSFANSGTVSVTSFSTLWVTGANFHNVAGGIMQFDSATVLDAATTNFVNDGLITASAGMLQLVSGLAGVGDVMLQNGAVVELDSFVDKNQSIHFDGPGLLRLNLPVFAAGTIDGMAVGDTINLGLAATALSYSANDLKLQVIGTGQTFDLAIAGPFSLSDFSLTTNGTTTDISVTGTSASAPMLSGGGNSVSYPAGGAAVPVDTSVSISDADSTTLAGAVVAVTAGSYANDGDVLSATTAGTAITASYNPATETLTLSGQDSLANYQQVLRSVGFSSTATDPTKATANLTRTITWVVNDGTATSAPISSTVTLQPPGRTLSWTGSAGSNVGTATNWADASNGLTPANLAPGSVDTAIFTASGGNITGSASVAALSFGGGAAWHLAAGSMLSSTGSIGIGSAGATALLLDGGADLLGGSATIAGVAGADGAGVSVSGPGSGLQIGGMLSVGEAAFGLLTVSAGGMVTAGALDVAGSGAGAGIISVVGVASGISVAGSLIVGDAASGELSILSGGTVSAQDATIGAGANATGNVDIQGAGSHLDVANDLNIGLGGVGVLTLGNNTELTVVNNLNIGTSGVLNSFGGIIDPAVVNNTGRAGGKGQISASVSIVNSGTLFAASGTETLIAPIITSTGVLEIDAGGNLAVNVGSVVATQTVNFTDGTGILTISTLGGFAATIGSFLDGDSIVLPGTTIAATQFDGGTHVLTLFDASSNVAGTLQFGPSITNGSSIVVNGVAPCFVAGTRISTERGEVCVEDLMVGDVVQVVLPPPPNPLPQGEGEYNPDSPSSCGRGLGGGGVAPVIWLGHRTVDCAHHPRKQQVWPVRIAAHAFGRGRPARELWLSPDHALYIDGVLIPVKHLINGTSIQQVPVATVTYYHVELPHHAVLLAENLAAESYLDTGDRANFANADGPTTLHPDFASRAWDAAACAPLVVTGQRLGYARRWLRALAAARPQRGTMLRGV